MAKHLPPLYPFAIGRRKHRLQRLRLHPERAKRSETETVLRRTLEAALHQLRAAAEEGAEAREEARALRERLARAQADVENVRRRMRREKEETRKYAAQNFVEALIPALDSFDLALASLDATEANGAGVVQGIQAIRQQIDLALYAQGLEVIPAQGETFDPNVHEALAVEKTDAVAENTVIEVIQNGYRLNGRVVRPARVRVAHKP